MNMGLAVAGRCICFRWAYTFLLGSLRLIMFCRGKLRENKMFLEIVVSSKDLFFKHI